MGTLPTRRSSVEAATLRRPTSVLRRNLQRPAPRSVEAKSGIITGSVLGGTALVLVGLFLVLFLLWHRRGRGAHAHGRQRNPIATRSAVTTAPKRTSPTPTPTPMPRRPRGSSAAQPATPSFRRLAVRACAGPPPSSPRRWRREKAAARVHTPSGRPAVATSTTTTTNGDNNTATQAPSNGFLVRGDRVGNTIQNSTSGGGSGRDRDSRLGDLLLLQRNDSGGGANNDGNGNGNGNMPPRETLTASVSSAFAAEMSSLLESISLKSSYSSLRSGGLGVPPRARAWRPQGAGGGGGGGSGSVSSGGSAMEGDGGGGGEDGRTHGAVSSTSRVT